MKKILTNLRIPNIVYVLLSGFFLRIILSSFGTLQLDYGTFVSWSSLLAKDGFRYFYSGWSDYLPGYLYALFILGKLNLIPAFQVILFKLPAILADVATGYLIYKIALNYKTISINRRKMWGIILSLIYVFNPAIFANSSLWGQVDSVTAFFSLFAVYLASINKKVFSAIILAIGTLIKPQAAFILPGIIYLIFKNKWKIKETILYIISGLTVFTIGFIPFNNTSNLFKFILERLSISANQYPYGSVNAFSFWGLLGFWKPDNISFWIGAGICVLSITIVLYFLRKKENLEYSISAISLLISFLFLTRMHERHLLPVLAPLLLASLSNPVVLIVYIGLSLTYLANLTYSYYWITNDFKEIFNPVIIKFFILTNLSLLSLFIVSQFRKIKLTFNLKFKKARSEINYFGKDITNKKAKILLFGILLFSLITRIYSLGLPKEKYFDEVYHAFTAGLVLHNDPKAWEWWNPHPEGFAYEWTHPPVAKLGMTLGMIVFGENAFGWRIVQALLGVGSIYLVYLIASFVFKDKLVGILSSFLFSLDGLVLVINRIGMNDSYLLFFSLLSIYLFLKDKNFLSSLFFGLAIASKWSAIYSVPIFFISHFVFKKKFKVSYLSFLVIPILVYIASYGVMFKTGHTWENFIEVQKQMWWYHTNLIAEHPYTSPAYTWPMLVRPIYLYNGPETDGFVSRIYAFGNPAVFWFGLFSVILSIAISFKERNKKLGFIIFSYLIFFVPWIASPRIMFLYHYLPSIPFMVIASGFILRRFPKAIIPVFTTLVLLFVYFYPHWAGLRIPEWLDRSYYWFSSWR